MQASGLLQTRRAEREAFLQRAVAILGEDQRVGAVWLSGSLGRGTADDLSDIDLWVVVEDERSETVDAARRDHVTAVGEPLLVVEAPQNAPAGGAYLLTWYPGRVGPHQIDWYWQPQATARVPRHALVLFDRVGIPQAVRPAPLDRHDRGQAAGERTIFFWVMSHVVAKTIARRRSRAALSLIAMIEQTLAEVKRLLDGNADLDHQDRRADLPPVQPRDQLALLRELADEMQALMPRVAALGGSVPADAVPHVARFFDLVASMVHEGPPPDV